MDSNSFNLAVTIENLDVIKETMNETQDLINALKANLEKLSNMDIQAQVKPSRLN